MSRAFSGDYDKNYKGGFWGTNGGGGCLRYLVMIAILIAGTFVLLFILDSC